MCPLYMSTRGNPNKSEFNEIATYDLDQCPSLGVGMFGFGFDSTFPAAS